MLPLPGIILHGVLPFKKYVNPKIWIFFFYVDSFFFFLFSVESKNGDHLVFFHPVLTNLDSSIGQVKIQGFIICYYIPLSNRGTK